MITRQNNKIFNLCCINLIDSNLDSHFNSDLFDQEFKLLLVDHLEDLYKIDELDNNKDLLSKVVYLSLRPEITYGGITLFNFEDKKHSIIRNLINRSIAIFAHNKRPFLGKSTLLRDLVHYYNKLELLMNAHDVGIGSLMSSYRKLEPLIGRTAKFIIDNGIDLNYIHKDCYSDGDTTLMLLFKYVSLGSYIVSIDDFPCSALFYAINKCGAQINVDIQNNNGDTILTYLTKVPSRKEIFEMFKTLMSLCKTPLVIYKSELHYKAILALSSINLECVRTMPKSTYCNIVELLYNKYPCPNNYNQELLIELELTETKMQNYRDCCFNYHRYYDLEYKLLLFKKNNQATEKHFGL